jgi:hypothetical protein
MLKKHKSWVYLERANDGSAGVLFIVRQSACGKITAKSLFQ